MTQEVTGAIGILERDGNYLLVANWRTLDGVPRLCWDLPGGAVEAGESLSEACEREFLEETGRRVAVRDLAFLIERFGFRGAEPNQRSRFYFFHVDELAEHGPPSDPKIVAVEFCSERELRERCTQTYHREMLDWFAEGRRRRYYVTECRRGRSRPAR